MADSKYDTYVESLAIPEKSYEALESVRVRLTNFWVIIEGEGLITDKICQNLKQFPNEQENNDRHRQISIKN